MCEIIPLQSEIAVQRSGSTLWRNPRSLRDDQFKQEMSDLVEEIRRRPTMKSLIEQVAHGLS